MLFYLLIAKVTKIHIIHKEKTESIKSYSVFKNYFNYTGGLFYEAQIYLFC